jgi:hypothetical protein
MIFKNSFAAKKLANVLAIFTPDTATLKSML